MEKHEDIMKQILNGKRSPELEEHLRSCSECRELVSLDQWLRENPGKHDAVPAALDQQILSYVAAKKRPMICRGHLFFFVSRIAVPAAAALAVCFCLFTSRIQSYTAHPVVSKVSKVQKTWDSMDTELLMLTCNIEDDNALVVETAAISQGKGY